MRVEVPRFKKCCFCIPLRYGLLAWGYLKLLVALLYLVMMLLASTKFMLVAGALEAITVIILLCLVDISLNIVFIVGAHKKNFKLLRVYYYASIVSLVLYSLLYLTFISLQIVYFSSIKRRQDNTRFYTTLAEEVAAGLINILLQIYVLLLIRSEILKLKANCRFQFVNNADAAECNMKVQEEATIVA